jgi:succinate dehydrogenase/fumarate reductase flavoprotein subunit
MEQTVFEYGDNRFPLYRCNTLIIGSGAAALNCACHLREFGVEDLLIVTERLGGGVSNNSGSDKQTYYKLALWGEEPDSVAGMARTLFSGGAMHGDIALVEATLSAQEFLHLVHLGVVFPHNRYGGYIGYKTDHDPKERATSAGPWTSNQMFQKLLDRLRQINVPVLDGHEIISLITAGGPEPRVIGAVALDKTRLDQGMAALVLFQAENIVMGTGGPGGLYRSSVYPEDHLGSTGVAIEAGAVTVNMAEWQFGMASTRFRWNVSGTYQQVIPRYISTAGDGSDEREFLNEYFPSMGKLGTAIFLKGYQWPFDPRKIENYGSSLIDILVYRETVLHGRRVFLDFRRNPSSAGSGLSEFRLEDLEPEALRYLQKSDALLETPLRRLEKMNPMAIALYRQHGIDLAREPLEIAVCAQHHNGGLKGNIWWESNLRHLFPIGEANGSHGVFRPGGSALNSGQVGGYRAAEYIAARYRETRYEDGVYAAETVKQLQQVERVLSFTGGVGEDLTSSRRKLQDRMTKAAAHIRSAPRVKEALKEAVEQWIGIENGAVRLKDRSELLHYFQNRQLCLTQLAVLRSIDAYLDCDGGSRGSYLVLDENGAPVSEQLPPEWRFRPEKTGLRGETLEFHYCDGAYWTAWKQVRPMPEADGWFENVWRDYTQKKIYD